MSQAALQPWEPGGGPEDDVHLSLRDHLMELRKRLKYAALFLVIGFCACYYWSQQIFHFLMLPVFRALPEGEKALHFSSGVEPFLIYLKLALYARWSVTAPAIFWQNCAHSAQARKHKGRGKTEQLCTNANLFYVARTSFCFVVILNHAFEFLINSAGLAIKPMLIIDDQLGQVLTQ